MKSKNVFTRIGRARSADLSFIIETHQTIGYSISVWYFRDPDSARILF